MYKHHLRKKFSHEEKVDPKILVVDEIFIRKGHTYLTLVADWDSGRVLWVVTGRSYETLKQFFDSLSDTQRASLMAVAMDMWNPQH
jgi:transposase